MINLELTSNDAVLMDGVSMSWAIEMKILEWWYRQLLLLMDLRRIVLLRLDDVIIRHFFLLPLCWWLELLGLRSSSDRNIDGLFGQALASLGVGLLGQLLLPGCDLLV